MADETGFAVTLAAALIVAFLCGSVATRLRLPPIVGYLFAGMVLGPFTPGFVADKEVANQMATIGVILLMFGAGIQVSLPELVAVRRIAIPGALLGVSLSAFVGFAIMAWSGQPLAGSLVTGIAISVTSTVILLRNLMDREEIGALHGRTLIGWSVVEDLLTIVLLVLMPTVAILLAADVEPRPWQEILAGMGLAMGKAILFGGLVLVIGPRAIPWMLNRVAWMGSREMFMLAILAIAIGIAVSASLIFGVSFALGAFLAGLVLGETDLSHQAAAQALPLRDAFAVLFFVAVGMLFDPHVVLSSPGLILALMGVVLLSKPLVGLLVAMLSGYPRRSALLVVAGLAQFGEFAFITVGIAGSLGLISAEGTSLIVATALISMTINPFLFRGAYALDEWLRGHPRIGRVLEVGGRSLRQPDGAWEKEELRGHAVLCGYGRVGSTVGQILERRNVHYAVVDYDSHVVEGLRKRGIPALFGDASSPELLAWTNLKRARILVVAVPDFVAVRRIVDNALSENPQLDIVVRTHSLEEKRYLEARGVREAVVGELELALEMTRHTLSRFGVSAQEVQMALQGIRLGT